MRKKQREKNIAFIDGQNLHLSTQSDKRKIDMNKFRVYLRDKFNVTEAYYFLWYISEEEQDLYTMLQNAWFIVLFREHTSTLKGTKKWNVDVDIVFEIMKRVHETKDFDKIVLVSGDGDYVKLVKRLIQHQLLKKIIFPNKQYSSLYDDIRTQYGMTLWTPEIKKKIRYFTSKKKKISTDTKKEVS